MKRRVVITGVGVIAPNGATTDDFWKNCLNGTGAVGPIPDHWRLYSSPTSSLWAPLPPAVGDSTFVNRIEKMQLDRITVLALGACRQALAHAGVEIRPVDAKKNTYSLGGIDPGRCGVFVGTGMGGITSFADAEANNLLVPIKERLGGPAGNLEAVSPLLRMPARFNPFVVSMIMPNAVAAAVGIKLSVTGPNRTGCQACAAGTFAIGDAFREILDGTVDCAIAGGAEYLGDDYGGIYRGFDIAKTLVRNCADPATANRPFDRLRSGFLFAEGGAAMLMLESHEHAQARGAAAIAEIVAFAESFDAHSLMAVETSSRAAERMIRSALGQAGITPGDVDYINAHATGTELNDDVEAGLIGRIFGGKVLINATKSLTGHPIGAAGAIETAVTALSLRDQTTHACANLEDPVADLNFVRRVTPRHLRYGLTQSFAFGGHNAALVLRAPD